MATDTNPAARLAAALQSELAANDYVVTAAAISLARDLRAPGKALTVHAAKIAAATLGIGIRFSAVGDHVSRAGINHEASIIRVALAA